MLITIIDALPLAVCLFWMMIHGVMVFRTRSYWHVMVLLACIVLYLFSDCCYYNPGASYSLLTAASNLSQFSGPCIIPLVLLYIHNLRTGKQDRTIQLTWIFVPVILFTAAELLTAIAGREDIEVFIEALYTGNKGPIMTWNEFEIRLYYYFAVIVFRVVLVVEVIVLVSTYFRHRRIDGYRVEHVKNFFFHGGRISIVELQYFNMLPAFVLVAAKLFLFRDFLVSHVGITLFLAFLMAILLCPFCFATLFGAKKMITFREMWHGFLYNYRPENKNQIMEEIVSGLAEESDPKTLMHLQDVIGLDLEQEGVPAPPPPEFMTDHSLAHGIFSAVPKSPEEESLMGRFEQLMTVDRAFLQPGLTLVDVADQLDTNKSYISRLVNNTYKLPFPDLINTLRIDYAQEYIVTHREATQAEIAVACGFPSASSLNIAFKKVTGMTPRIWLATYDHYHGLK